MKVKIKYWFLLSLLLYLLLTLYTELCSSNGGGSKWFFSSVQFTRSVVSDSLRPHWLGLQHARPPYLSPTPWVYSNSCPLSRWCHPLLLYSIFPNIRVFSNESVLCIRRPKYWSFSFSIRPSNKYSGLTSFRMERLDIPAVQGTL